MTNTAIYIVLPITTQSPMGEAGRGVIGPEWHLRKKGGGRHIIGFAAIRLGDWYYGGMNASSVSDKFVETCPDFRP